MEVVFVEDADPSALPEWLPPLVAARFEQEDRQLISRLAASCEAELEDHLGLRSLRLKVGWSPFVLPQTGETGYSASPDEIWWFVHPDVRHHVARVADNRLRHTVFHEAHHCARRAADAMGETLPQFAVSEGLATAFERDAAGSRPPYGVYDEGNARAWLDELYEVTEPDWRPWLFTYPDGRPWIAYQVGVYVVDEAIRRHGGSAAGRAGTSSDEILEQAGLSRN